MYAISSAGLTHALAKACSAGRMERCTCDEAPDLENRKAWQWGGCGDNLKYANKFVKDFLGKRSNKDLRARVDMHNTNVGMKVRLQELECDDGFRKSRTLSGANFLKMTCHLFQILFVDIDEKALSTHSKPLAQTVLVTS